MNIDKDVIIAARGEENIIAVRGDGDRVVFMNISRLIEYINVYSDPFESFFYFMHGLFIWRAPNSHIDRFMFAPNTGEKIDWWKLYEKYKEKVRGYSLKLEYELLERTKKKQ